MTNPPNPTATATATYCPHGRVFPDQCEDCRFVAAMEAGNPTAAAAAVATGERTRAPRNEAPTADPDVVDVDTRIGRPDLGRGAYTFVRAGDPVPAALVDLPREAAPSPVPDATPARAAKSGTSRAGGR